MALMNLAMNGTCTHLRACGELFGGLMFVRSAARIGVAIAGAGAIPLLVSLLVPPVVGVQGAAALALKNLARNGTLRAPAL